MLLEFIPPSPALPSFSLSIDFADFTHGHPNPFAWSTQLQVLLEHELDLPRSLHMLDRAAGLTAVLERVRFDLRPQDGGTCVRCDFVDGAVVEWEMPRNISLSEETTHPFLKAVQRIVKDIHMMRLEEERAKLAFHFERLQDQTAAQGKSASFGPSRLARRFTVGIPRNVPSVPTPELVVTKSHKRQKSFLQIVVNAVGSIVSRDSQTAPTRRPSPRRADTGPLIPLSAHPSHIRHPELPGPSTHEVAFFHDDPEPPKDSDSEPPLLSSTTHKARASFHRERVRAALADAYRQFVLARLTGGSSLSVWFSPTPEDERRFEEDDGSHETCTLDSPVASVCTTTENDDRGSGTPMRKRRPPTPNPVLSASAASSLASSFVKDKEPNKRELYSYHTWVLKSMLRRTEEEMENILRECEEQRKREMDFERFLLKGDGDGDGEGNVEQQQQRNVRNSDSAFKNGGKRKSKSKSKLKPREDSVASASASAAPVPRFRLGSLIKRKSKPSVGISNLSPFQPSSPSSAPSASVFESTATSKRTVHFVTAATSSSHDGTDRFSPPTMDVPVSFSDESDEDESEDRETSATEDDLTSVGEESLSLDSRSRTASTTSSCATTESDAETETRCDTAATSTMTTPASSLLSPQPSERSECSTPPSSKTPSHESISEEVEGVQLGYAVTCDEAVSAGNYTHEGEAGRDVTVTLSHPPLEDDSDAHSLKVERGEHCTTVTPMPTFLTAQDQHFTAPPGIMRPTKPFILPEAYNRMLDLTHKLRSLLIHASLATQAAHEEEQRLMDMLELKGRRRAWSNGAFVKGVSPTKHRSGHSHVNEHIIAHARIRAEARGRECRKWAAKNKQNLQRPPPQEQNENEGGHPDEKTPSERELPPLPLMALSGPFQSSPLALAMYTAEDQETKHGLVYVCPVKELTVFYLASTPVGAPVKSKRGGLSVDDLHGSVESSRERDARSGRGNVRGSGAAGLTVVCDSDVFMDEDSYIFQDAQVNDFQQLDDMERGSPRFPTSPTDTDDDDGIEWQSNDSNAHPRSLPANSHPPPFRLLPVDEADRIERHESPISPTFAEEGDEEDDRHFLTISLSPPRSTNSAPSLTSEITAPVDSLAASQDGEEEYEYDRRMLMSMSRESLTQLLKEAEDEAEDYEEDDDDDDFFADISHITHFVDDIEDGLGRQSAAALHMSHRQRRKASSPKTASIAIQQIEAVQSGFGGDGEGPVHSPSTNGGIGSKIKSNNVAVADVERPKEPFPTEEQGLGLKRGKHQRRLSSISLEVPADEATGSVHDHRDDDTPMPAEASPEATVAQPRMRKRSMYQLVLAGELEAANGVFADQSPTPPVPSQRSTASASSPSTTQRPPSMEDAGINVCREPYISYHRVDIGGRTVRQRQESMTSLAQDSLSLLCQPVRFSHAPVGIYAVPNWKHPAGVPIVNRVTKALTAGPPPSLDTGRVQGNEQKQDVDPDVPRSPSPISPGDVDDAAPGPLSPSSPPSLSGSIISRQSSLGPQTPSNSTLHLGGPDSSDYVEERIEHAHGPVQDKDVLEESIPHNPYPHLPPPPPYLMNSESDTIFIDLSPTASGGDDFLMSLDADQPKRRSLQPMPKKQPPKNAKKGGEYSVLGKKARTVSVGSAAMLHGSLAGPGGNIQPRHTSAPGVPPPVPEIKGTTTTKSAMRRQGIAVGKLASSAA